MNRDTIYIRTEKGERALAAPQELAPGLDSILGAFDGQSSLEALSNRLDPLNASLLDVGVAALLEGDLIRDASQGPSAGTATDEHARKAQELRDKIRDRRQGGDRGRSSPAVDAWYKAKREVEQVAAREAEAQARRAAEEQVRRAAEEQARRAAEEQARRAAEEQAKRAAEEQARRAAAEYARRAAEDEARRQEEERARQEAEERARHEAEREKQEAEERARRAEEEKARAAALAEEQRAAAEQARQRAEVQARLLAEEAAWQEAEERARAEEAAAKEREQEQAASAEAFKRSGRPRNIGKSVGISVVGLVVIGLAALHVVPFDGQIPQFEKALGSQFQQPVKIKSIHLALLPGSQVRLEGVSIGAEGQIKVATVRAAGSIGNLFSENKSFKAVELESPAVTEEGLGWIMFGKRPAGDIPFGEVTVSGGTLESKRIALPAFDGKLQLDEGGGWKTLALGSTDKTMQVLLTAKGSSAQIEGRAAAFKLPFGSTLSFEDFSINGTVDRAGLTLTEFKGFVHGGTLSGTAALKWGPTWTLSGEVNAKQIDTARVVPELMGSARLEGKASYVMQAADSAKLFDLARAEGSFAIPRGTLLGLDLGSVLQGGATRGETKFGELTGSFSTDQGVTQLKQLRMSQGNMSASGNLDIDAEKKIRGRITAELRLSTEARRINLSVSGTPAKLDWQR